MKELYFLRHGEADWPNWGKPDDERPLTAKGRAELQKIARLMSRLRVKPALVLTSPLPRAAQTAEIVAHELELQVEIKKALRPGFGRTELRRLLKTYDLPSLLLVGHEPDFSSTIEALTGADIILSKAGLALVELYDRATTGRLRWLLPPRLAKSV